MIEKGVAVVGIGNARPTVGDIVQTNVRCVPHDRSSVNVRSTIVIDANPLACLHTQAAASAGAVGPTKVPRHRHIAAHRQDRRRWRWSRRWCVWSTNAEQRQRLDANSRLATRNDAPAIQQHRVVVKRDVTQPVASGPMSALLPNVDAVCKVRDAHQGGNSVGDEIIIDVGCNDKRNVSAVVCELIDVDLADKLGATAREQLSADDGVGNADDAWQIGQSDATQKSYVGLDIKERTGRCRDVVRTRRLLGGGGVGKKDANPNQSNNSPRHLQMKKIN